jgi:hypothetical protein
MANTENEIGESALERAARAPRRGILADVWGFLGQNKKWWLTPIILVMLLVGVLVVLGGSAAAPFIYTLF